MAPEKVVVKLPSKVVVPFECVKIPWFDQLPAMVNEEDVGAIKVEEVEIVVVPFTSNDGLLFAAVTITAFIPSPIVKLLFVTKAPEPRLYVGDPAPNGIRFRL